MLAYDAQLATEHTYSRKVIKDYILRDLRETPVIEAKMLKAVALVIDWMKVPADYQSKQERKNHLLDIDIETIVEAIIAETIQCITPTKLTVVAGKLYKLLKFEAPEDGLKTIGELIVVVCGADLYDLIPPVSNDTGMWCIRSCYQLDPRVTTYIENTLYMPPMLCEPNTLHKNTDSAYLTYKHDSVILKSHNHHNEEVCLEHINRCNKTELSLSMRMLTSFSEDHDIANKVFKGITRSERNKAKDLYLKGIEKSYQVYRHLVASGNVFHLPHKYCKRGRTYAQGYHCSTQGTPFKKAIVELAKQEVITTHL